MRKTWRCSHVINRSSWDTMGDEGKGKITDFLAEQSDVIARFQVVIMQAIQFNLAERHINYI